MSARRSMGPEAFALLAPQIVIGAELALRPLGKLQIGADQIDNARLAGPVIHFQQPAGVAFAGGDYLDDFAGVASGLARRIDAAAFHVTPHIPRPPMGRKHRRFPA